MAILARRRLLGQEIGPAERAQERVDQVPLGLRLVGISVDRERLEDPGDVLAEGIDLGIAERLPRFRLGDSLIEEILGEERSLHGSPRPRCRPSDAGPGSGYVRASMPAS